MGTNYYLHLDPATREPSVLHIGKASGGWCFSLHVIPTLRLHTLEDWKAEFALGRIIDDSEGEQLSVELMLKIITERKWPHERPAGWLEQNGAEPGPNGLARHRIGPGRDAMGFDPNSGCCGHGEGTWDYIRGDFS